MKPDLANLRRVIECGIKDAAKDAGLKCIILDVNVQAMPDNELGARIGVMLVEISPEQY